MTVKIGYKEFKVLFQPLIVVDSVEVDATHSSRSSEIELCDKLPVRRMKQRLIHESIHSMETIYNIDELTEEQVDSLAMGFLAFIWDNPELIKTIQNKDEPLE